MKIFGDSQAINANGEQSAIKGASAARWRSGVRGWGAAMAFVLAAGCLLVCVVALQVLFVGAADTLGLTPQVSFLSLNLAFIALFSWLSLPKVRLSLKRGRRRKTATVGAFRFNAASPLRPACKVLVIRRLTGGARAERRKAWRVFDERSKSREVAVDT